MLKSPNPNELSRHFKYAPLATEEAAITREREEYAKQNSLVIPKMVDNTCYVGIEVECENVVEHMITPFGWTATQDGSLRNRGLEFVSFPVRGQNVYYLLHRLFAELKRIKAEFTERTSIHVHLNVRRMSVEQLVTLLITYTVVEKTLYRFARRSGFSRERNIFCVPVQEGQNYLGLPYLMHLLRENMVPQVLAEINRHWKKYSGFNILPVSTQGTVEFRQLGGTFDINLIMDWINIIQCLRSYAFNNELDVVTARIVQLNTNSDYHNFLKEIFGRYSDMLFDHGQMNFSELEEGVIAVKQALALKKIFNTDDKTFLSSSLADFLMKTLNVQFVSVDLSAMKKEYARVEEELTRITKHAQTLRASLERLPGEPSEEQLREYGSVQRNQIDLQNRYDQLSYEILMEGKLVSKSAKKQNSLVSIYGRNLR